MDRIRSLCIVAGLILLGTTPGATVPAVADPDAAPRPGFVRGAYGRDSTPDGVSLLRATGFDTVTVNPWRHALDALEAAGMRGVVWLWDYDDARCAFEKDDGWVREVVSEIAGHPAILAYQIADEPSFAMVDPGCRNVPGQIRQRARLVESLDPGATTYVVIPTWDGRESFPYESFAGTTDVMGLDVYPCWHQTPECDFDLIDDAVAAAERDGVRRYWAVVQDFGDGWYRPPTAAELDEQLRRWAASGMEGYFVYHWNEGSIESKPDHLAVLAKHNLLTRRFER